MMSLLFSGLARWAMMLGGGALLLAGAYFVGYTKGTASAEYKLRYAQAMADKKAAEDELRNIRLIFAAQEKLAANYQQKVKEDDAKMADLEAYVRTLPAGACELPTDFLQKLDDLR